VDKLSIKRSTKGTNFQAAKLIRQGATVNDALAAAQQAEEFSVMAKRNRRRQRLGM
jgi:hypothetical protein